MRKPNFRLGKRGSPGKGGLSSFPGKVRQWKPGGEREPPNPNYFPEGYTDDLDYVEGEQDLTT